MLMFVDMGGGGVHEKITDYVDMGRGLLKFDFFTLKVQYALKGNNDAKIVYSEYGYSVKTN